MAGLWLVYSLLVAFFSSTIAIISKKAMKGMDSLTTSIIFKAVTVVALLPFVALNLRNIPTSSNFLTVLFMASMLNGTSTLLYFHAVKHGEVSLAVPLLTLTPAFMLLTSPLILQEFPPVEGVAGIILIVVGAYVLSVSSTFPNNGMSLFTPFINLIKDRSAASMLAVAFIWSITANLDKVGAKLSTTIQWIFLVNLLSLIILLSAMLAWNKKHISILSPNSSSFLMLIILAGAIHAIMNVIQIEAIMMTYASYVIAIKRMSALFTVIFARAVLKEGAFPLRALASFLMVCGAAILALS